MIELTVFILLALFQVIVLMNLINLLDKHPNKKQFLDIPFILLATVAISLFWYLFISSY